MTVNIVIADDHGVLRGGLRAMLNAEPDFKVVGEAEDGFGAIRTAHELHPNVLLADISMPGPSGIEVARLLREQVPSTSVVILTMHEDQCMMQEASEAGARGYVPKRAADSELIRAIREVVAGGIYWYGGTEGSPAPAAGAQAKEDVALDQAEKDLLQLLVHGHTNADIASRLGVTPDVAADRRRRLMERLSVRNRVDLIRYASEHGLL